MGGLRFTATLDREKSTPTYPIYRAVEEVSDRSLASVYLYAHALDGDLPVKITVEITWQVAPPPKRGGIDPA